MFFSFSKSASSPSDLPLFRIGGELLIDSGNEDPSYLFRAQERYLPYTNMQQGQSLFFVQDQNHASTYEKRFLSFQAHLQTLSHFSGLTLKAIEPIYLKLDEQLRVEMLGASDFPPQAIQINQLSPLLVKILEQISGLVPTDYDLEQYRRVADLTLRLSNKAEYLRVLAQCKEEDLPYHTPTLILQEEELYETTFKALQERFLKERGENCPELFIKSALDSGGELSGVLDEKNFEQKVLQLAHESKLKQRQQSIEILVQRRLRGFSCVGFSYFIESPEKIERITASGQIYEDEERKEFLGAILSDRLEKSIFNRVDENKLIRLCQTFANLGYRGPINFDAMENTDGEYEFVADCNPRLSAVFPNLAVRQFLRSQGVIVERLANLGYRGRIQLNDYSKTLEELEKEKLLFSKDKNEGLWLLPSFTGTQNFDFWFVNLKPAMIEYFVNSSFFQNILNSDDCDFKGIYF